MMNGEHETTARPVDILRNQIIYNRDRVINSIEQYHLSGNDETVFFNLVKPKIQTLYLMVRAEFKPEENPDKIFKEKNISKIIEFYNSLDDWFNKKNLISFANLKRM